LLLVIAEEDRELFNEKFAGHAAILGIQTVLGGAQRGDSVRNALQQVSSDCTMVAIHDAARPCVTNQSIEAVFAKARMTQAAILAVPCSSTLKRVDGQQQIVQTVPRQDLWLAQTPQCFSKQLLIECYESHPNSSAVTDESTLLEECGYPVSVVEDSSMNVKVTSQQDFKFVEMALKSVPQSKPFPF
jgi:2-C-methyl-D-erythritol 4-phosphate cytidylyltransferase